MTKTAPPIARCRRLVLVDAENLAGTPNPSAARAAAGVRCMADLLAGTPDAHVIVASSHRAASVFAFAWPSARHLWRSGPDGADLALIGVLEHERVAERFTEVVLVSGDGIFAEPMARLATSGLQTTVLSLAGNLSARLRMAAGRVIELDHADGVPETGSAA